ncbi:MAG: phosphoenolpyruvate--protein phosphotransferase, partial [Bifidobacteriaceae bacterium]|nr:phosphoenolpyruvate--protein phosphotransferase [Bifidobacteriaceae bacterium]
DLATRMQPGGPVPIAIAAGAPDGTLGTDATAVARAVKRLDQMPAGQQVSQPSGGPAGNPASERASGLDGILLLVDMGSAVLSAELALKLLGPDVERRARVTPAPLVEGLVAAVVTASSRRDATLEEVAAEAARGLTAKLTHLGEPVVAPVPADAAAALAPAEITPAPAGTGPATAAADAGGPGAAPGVGGGTNPSTTGLAPGQPTSQTEGTASATPAAPTTPAAAPAPPETAVAVFTVTAKHGIHARPAALMVGEAAKWDAKVRIRNVTTGSGWVDAASLAGVTTIAALRGHQVEVDATGPQAQAAVYAIVALADTAFGETDEATASPGPPPSPVTAGTRPASPGYAIGPVCVLVGGPVAVPLHEPGTAEEQITRLDVAIATVSGQLQHHRAEALRRAGAGEAAIFDAHLLMLRDPAILEDARGRILAGHGPAAAWGAAMGAVEARLDALGDDYLRTRAADVRGLCDQVLGELLGIASAHVSGPGVLVAADLPPSQAAVLNPDQVYGVVLAGGSPTAHAAIMARSLGIPMVTGAGPDVLNLETGTVVAVDGTNGDIVVDPDKATVTRFERLVAKRRDRLARAARAAHTPARMAGDGPVIQVNANIASVEDAERAAAAGADGLGLVRTEFLFSDIETPPSRAEQEEAYRAIAAAMDGRRVIFRTLDAGGDKPLRYMPLPAEDNPFLGVRGLRLSLRFPKFFADQLAALVSVARDYPVGIMFPMVSTVSELRRARAELARAAYRELGRMPGGLTCGMMVEVPAVALKAGAFAPAVDFFSVGTNDLTQYALASDRGNPALAGIADGLDPGVLALIRRLCVSARGKTKVSVCGELAADPAATAILLGLGVRGLSVAPPAVAEVKERVRNVSRSEARA